MTVKQMLSSMDSREYSRWIAWEAVNGPIDDKHWEQNALASIHEQLQNIAYILSQANFSNEDNPEGPIPMPSQYPRPFDLPKDEPADGVEDVAEEWLPPAEDIGNCPPGCVCRLGKQARPK